MRRFLILVLLLSTGFRSPAAQETEPLTKKQAKVLSRTAKTPEDHLRLAAYYRHEAARLLAEAAEEEAMAAEYDRNPASHPIPKGITYGENCRNLARYYREQARNDTRIAERQEATAEAAK